ncbi:hypothetical protein GCM10009117_09610 [Gangjinia marincola]|uniref:DUF4397 domain-containing protein n=1 Tax=Gangjinia marincola TaxID=578463 RepID=A0ABP3XTY8_9FLAO
MKKNYCYLFSSVLFLFSVALSAQNARVQIIHNSPDANASAVDVYVNDALLPDGDDVQFRTATPFFDAPAGVPITIDIAPGDSDDSGDSIFDVTVTLDANENYIIVANGILPGSTGYNPSPNFSLDIFTGALESGTNTSFTDILIHHGSTDAPTVDIVETSLPIGTIVDDISYPEFEGYEFLPVADYILEVQTADNVDIVATYSAPLATLDLGNNAITVLASGFLDPSQNNDGPAFGLFVATTDGGALLPLPLIEFPLNDEPVDAEELNCGDSVTGNTDNANDSGGSGAGDVFFTYQGIGDFETVTLSTCGDDSDFNTSIRVFDSVDLDNEVASNDDFCGNQSEVIFLSNGLTNYYILVEGSGDNDSGNFELNLTCAAPTTSRVQIIHNSADLLVEFVDIYVSGGLIVDDLQFRSSTPFVDLPAGFDMNIGVAPSNSNSADDSIFTTSVNLDQSEKYIVVANGIVSPNGYDPNVPFSLEIFAGAREEATNGSNTDILVHHGATDAPPVDVTEVGVGAGTIVNNISYTEFQGYLELATDDYALSITPTSTTTEVAAYFAPLETLELEGVALTLLASGFLFPDQNSDGPEFGLWAAFADGGDLIELPTAPLSVDENSILEMDIFPNPAIDRLNISSVENIRDIAIINTLGQTVLKKVINAQETSIDVSGLATGMYFINAGIGTKTALYKLIKK